MAQEFANEFPGISWKVESDFWSIVGVLFGGFGSFPISRKATFDTRAMVGFINTNAPAFTITGTGLREAWLKQEKASATSFAYLLGVGLKFYKGSNLCLLTNLDHLAANPEFSNVELT